MKPGAGRSVWRSQFVAAALVLALGYGLPVPLGESDRVRSYPAWLRRAALGPEPPPFTGLLAASGLG
jgi:hypothetical protein